MSHLHMPDGVLPLWLVIAGWVGTAAALWLASNRAASTESRRKVPLVGAVAALMLVGMSSEIVPIAYHINLTVIAGILLGPWLSIVAAFVTVTMLAFVGHGGVTVIGLNTLVIAAEMLAGWALFAAFVRVAGQRRVAPAAAAATVLALALSTTLLVGIVALAGSPAATRESGAFDPGTLSFTNPFAEGVLANSLVAGGEAEPEAPPLSIARFALMVYGLGSIGWVLEAAITALVIGFVARVRPGLVFDGALLQPARAPLGDEGTHR